MKGLRFNRLMLIVLTIVLCASFAAAVLVFMSGDKTVKAGESANFRCTVDPMLGTAQYKIQLTGNGVDKTLQEGSVSTSVAYKDFAVGPSQYAGTGTYTVTCTATETSCDPCCCTSSTDSATLTVEEPDCPEDGWYCSPNEYRQFWDYFWNGDECEYSVTQEAEHCNDYDGCYAYLTGCEDRDYYCKTGTGSGPCGYTYDNRHVDSTDSFVQYCQGSLIKKHKQVHDYYCDALCKEHTSWTDDQVVDNCDDYDGWYGTSETQWVESGVCEEKEQSKKEYRDYTCSPSPVACTYAVTDVVWTDTNTTRFKEDGTTCNDGLWCTTPDYCVEGECTGEPRDCSMYSFGIIEVCDNIPDNIFYTWDVSPGFISVCDEINDVCTESNRTYTHACSIENCSAECETDADCDDQDVHTTDVCLDNCTCEHESEPYCGDGLIQPPEVCELPGTSDNSYCAQSTTDCSGYKLGTRDAFGDCDGLCGCTDDPFDYQCVAGECGAQCGSDDDCDDSNPLTTDTCLSDCTCKHEEDGPFCGDGIIETPEVCELPNTFNNVFCPQAITMCNGSFLGVRDMYGDCSAGCGCTYDPYMFHCVAGECGAECDAKESCPKKCVDNVRHYNGVCDLDETCGCDYDTEDCDSKDGWYPTASTRWIADGECRQKEQKEMYYRDYSCAPNACVYQVTNYTWADTNNTQNAPENTPCPDAYWCTTGDVCVEGECVRTPRDCSNNSYSEIGVCDNVPDNILFTWDVSPGFESVCDEENDVCTTQSRTYTHTCSMQNCSAECEIDADCDDKDPFTEDICLGNCTCENNWVGGCGDGTCENGETCSTCPSDCGTCPTVSSSRSGGGGGGGYSVASTTWECGDWSTCINGKERRTCKLNAISKEEVRECTPDEGDDSGDGNETEEVTTSSFTALESGSSEEETSVGASVEALQSEEDQTLVSGSEQVEDMTRITGFSLKDLGMSGVSPFWLFILLAGILAAFAGFKVLRK